MEKRNNLLYAWDRDLKLTAFLYSDVRAHGQTAYLINEAAKMLGCSNILIRKGEREGRWPAPQRWMTKDGRGIRFYSPDHIRQMRDSMAETHIGRPRDDGMVVPRASLPSAEELEVLLRGDEVLYIKEGDEFIPVWKAKF